MKIYVSKDNKQFGPFEKKEIETQLRQGKFSTNDFAWEEGMADWLPLKQVLENSNYGLSGSKEKKGIIKVLLISAVLIVISVFGILLFQKTPEEKMANRLSKIEGKTLSIGFGENGKENSGKFVLSDLRYNIQKTDSVTEPFICKLECRYDFTADNGDKEYIEELSIIATYQKQAKKWIIQELKVEKYGPSDAAEQLVKAAREAQVLISDEIKNSINSDSLEWYQNECKKASNNLNIARSKYASLQNLVAMALRPRLQEKIFE